MVLIHSKLTPEVLVTAPRRGPATPNPAGTLALYSLSTHTLGGRTASELRVMDIATGESERLLAHDGSVHDVVWLGIGNDVVYLDKGDRGATRVMMVDAGVVGAPHRLVVVVEAPVSALRLCVLGDREVAVAVAGLVGEDGELYNEEAVEKTTSMRVYDGINVRFWDNYLNPRKYTIWYTVLTKSSTGDVPWALDLPLRNALARTDLEAPPGMYMADGLSDGRDAYDLSRRGIVFVALDPTNTNPLQGAVSDVYLVDLKGNFTAARSEQEMQIRKLPSRSRGICASPRLSPDSITVAFLWASLDRPHGARISITPLDDDNENGQLKVGALDVLADVARCTWPLIPDAFEFAPNGRGLLILAQNHARVGLYALRLKEGASPYTVLEEGTLASFHPLRKGEETIELLVTTNSLTESSLYQIVDIRDGEKMVVSSASRNGTKLGLSRSQVSEFYFQGGGDYQVHSWIMTPHHFDKSKRYPLVLLVHGGPESAWTDAWSTRWNPLVWAEQGYIVVAPNITGSTGFGLDHIERIYGSWGGYPYDDLANLLERLKEFSYIDTDRAIVAGGSYGGYMMNWLNGNSLGRKFKAMVCHDGIYSLPTFLMQADSTSYVGTQEFKGTPYIWDNIKELDKHNPARPDLLKHWATPMLIIHSDKDYRCPITEGLAAYNTCQAKGIPSRFINFPDENHFVLKEENSLAWHHEVFKWINRWSGVAEDVSRLAPEA